MKMPLKIVVEQTFNDDDVDLNVNVYDADGVELGMVASAEVHSDTTAKTTIWVAPVDESGAIDRSG